MKNTLMFLLVSLLLAFSLTACGGGSQNGMDNQANGGAYNGGTNSGVTDGAMRGRIWKSPFGSL